MEVAVIRPRKHPLARALFRYLITGRPVLGPGDNATFIRDATVDHRGGPVEKLSRARWRRVARRHAALTVPAALLVWNWHAAALYGALGALAGLAYLGLLFQAWWPQRAVRAEYVVPTWTVVAKILGIPARRKDAIRAVELPPGFGAEADDETGEAPELVVRIHLPMVALDEGTQKRIMVAAGQRLGIPDPAASWVVRGASAHVTISPRVHAPRTLTFAEVRHYWTDASATKPFVGLGPKRVPVYADLDNDGPHIGISGGTGTGKSTLLRMILAKRVASGAGLVVCDYKVTSHKWARKLAQTSGDRVVYVTDEEPISEAILAVYAEFERRRNLLKVDPSALDDCRPVDLLVEELNSLAARLRTWWGHERRRILAEAKDLGEPAPYVPVVPPCVDALAALVQMGRELLIRVHFAAQRLDASALAPKDGGAIRESITNRFLAKYTKAAWNMLCAGIPYEAFPGGPRGIWTAVVNGEVTHFRVPPMSDDEAYALASSGPEPAGPVIGAARWVTAVPRPAIAPAVSLRDLAAMLPARPDGTRLSLDALRKASQRPGFPAPAGEVVQGQAGLYLVDEVMEWLATR